jgi:hypothetical protein
MEKPTGVIQKIIESLQQVNALDVYSPIEKDIILHNLRAAYMIFLNVSVDEQSEECRVEELGVEIECSKQKTEVETEDGRQETENEEIEEEIIEEEKEVVEVEDPIIEEVTVEVVKELDEVAVIEEEVEEKEVEEDINEEVREEVKEESEEVIEEEEIEEEVMEDKEMEEEVMEKDLIEEDVAEEVYKEEMKEEVEEKEVEQEVEFAVEVMEETKEEFVVFETPIVEKEPLVDDLLEFIPDAKPQSGLLFEDLNFPKTEKKSLNDLLTEKKEDQSLGTRFQQTFIPDLTKAIAINEKFTFIRELFRNSGVDFSNAIQKLNECENIDTAFAQMEVLKHQYLWDTTSTSYLSLCDLVRRRFL